MKLNPYLSFDGRCEEAFQFYRSCLGGEIVMLARWGDTPAGEQTPPEWHEKIAHARLVAGDLVLMGADAPPGRYTAPAGMDNILIAETVEEAESVFAALAVGGSIVMPMNETFFAQRFGMANDRFAIPWMVICERACDGGSAA